MVSCESKSGMVIAGRGARACDMCGKERAKWYCAADEAYLCDKCDGSVHSANAVARRHERVKLGPNGAPMKLKPSHSSHNRKPKTIHLSSLQHMPNNTTKNDNCDLNTTHQVPKVINLDSHKGLRSGSRKRPRTPRCKSLSTINSSLTQEVSNTSTSINIKEENEDSILLYDLLSADDDQFCMTFNVKPEQVEPFSPCPSSTLTTKQVVLDMKAEDTDSAHEVPTYEPLLQDLIGIGDDDGDFMDKILPPSDISLLGDVNHQSSETSKNEVVSIQTCKYSSNNMTEDSSFQACEFVEGSCSVVEDGSNSVNDGSDDDNDTFDVMDLCSDGNFEDDGHGEIKFEDGLANMDSWTIYGADQSACTSIFDGNPFKGKGEREFEMKIEELFDGDAPDAEHSNQSLQQPGFKRSLSLRLDYEDVLNAWSDRGSLWMDGQRPQIVPDICILGHGNVEHCGGMIMFGDSSSNSSGCQAGQVPLMVFDTGREARVLRYREKRRTRLFSKKIRYEVRKLNAERRPRMKGRFVKRSAIAVL